MRVPVTIVLCDLDGEFLAVFCGRQEAEKWCNQRNEGKRAYDEKHNRVYAPDKFCFIDDFVDFDPVNSRLAGPSLLEMLDKELERSFAQNDNPQYSRGIGTAIGIIRDPYGWQGRRDTFLETMRHIIRGRI